MLTIMMASALTLSACSNSNGDGASSGSGGKVDGNFNATGLPIVKEAVTLKMVGGKAATTKNFAEMQFFKDLEAKTNVKVDWELIPDTSLAEKINLLFASNELPDAFYGHYILQNNEVLKNGAQELLAPLESYIDKLMPNFKKILDANPSFVKELTAPDGHIYSLPTIDTTYPTAKDALFINKAWLDKLGLAVPTTTEEFAKVLKAFKDNDMNGNGKKDEIPFTFRYDNQNQGLYSMFGSFGLVDRMDKAANLNHIAMKEDKVTYTAVQPEYRKAIEYFNGLFKQDLMDKEAFTHDNKVYLAKVKSKEKNIGAFVGWSLTSIFGAEQSDFIALPPLKGPDGSQLWGRFNAGILSKGAFAVSSKNKNIEATIRWADQMYDPKISAQANKGVIGLNLKETADGKLEVIPAPDGMSSDEFRHKESPGSKSLFAITPEVNKMIIATGKNNEKEALEALYKPFQEKNIFPNIYFSNEENEELVKYLADIDSYVSKQYAKWLLQGGIDTEWDAYIKKLNDMGMDKMMKIYQDAYDGFKAK